MQLRAESKQAAAPVGANENKPWALRSLPPFPPVATRVIQLIGSDNATIPEVTRLISSDPAFSTEVIRLANSPLVGCKYEVNSIQHALSILGLARLRMLALSVTMRKYSMGTCATGLLKDSWRHNLACGFLCQDLCDAFSVPRDEAYTVGLIHDIGRLALLTAYPNEYCQMVMVSRENNFDVIECERELFDVDHSQAGAWLLRDWKFPEDMIQAVARHHEIPNAGTPNLARLVHVGCDAAMMLNIKMTGPPQTWNLDVMKAKMPPGKQLPLPVNPAEFREKLVERIRQLEASFVS